MIDIEFLKASIAKQLKKARVDRGYSQEEMGKMLRLGKGAYGAFERGRNLISLNYLLEISRILNKPLSFFIPGYISETELNDLTHDPDFADLMKNWPRITNIEDRKALAHIAYSMATKEERNVTE